MPATLINVALVLIGSALGLLFRGKIPARFTTALTYALGLCVLTIGVSSAIGTRNTLCVIVCMVVGTIIGELIRIEDRMDALGDFLRRKLMKGKSDSRFTEGFVSATVLYCVGAMAINGSLAAGLRNDWSIIVSKGVIDGVTSVSLAATLGVGVAFSAIPVLIYQGGLTLLAAAVGPALSDALVTEMSAIGGVIIIGIAVNMLNLRKEKLKVANMLPAIFLPIAYLPLAGWLGSLFG